MTAGEFAAYASGALAILGVLAVLVRVAVKIDRVEQMATELRPNGGGSIKDTVHRMDKTLIAVADRQEDHERRISKNEGRIEAIALVTSPTMLIEDDEGVLRESRRQGS